MASRKSAAISGPLFGLVSLLFFISGATGLAYQVVWFKRFSHVWGSSSLAFAAVGASFLFGLGVGAYLLGRRADRMSAPLLWYGACEVGIGLFALVIPFEIAGLADAAVGLYASIPQQPVLRFLVQFLITLLVIGPPCVLMGGTLPILIRQLTAREGSLDQATGWLYAVNTFGAAAGCYLTGFHLLPTLGLLGTNNLAAGVNISIGLLSLWVGVTARAIVTQSTHASHSTQRKPTEGAVSQRPWGMFALCAAVALAGCGALLLEMTWTRQLALVLGGSTYAYTATLFVVLIGIAVGSLLFHGWLRYKIDAPIVPVAVVLVLVAGTLAGKYALPWLSHLVAQPNWQAFRGDQWGNGLVCVGASALVELIPSIAMGILFPLFVGLTHANASKVGSVVGDIYAWNTLGSIVGANAAALLFFPVIGTTGTLALAAALYLVALMAMIRWHEPRSQRMGMVAITAGVVGVALLAPGLDPRLTNMGMYKYGDPWADASSAEQRTEQLAQTESLFFREGASSNVFVTRRGGRAISLRVNGKVDASSGQDMATQLGLAYFPRFFKPDAREVMVIGFGSGCTPGKSLLFPDTRVTCCEIEPAVYEAAHWFANVNDRPHEQSRSYLEAQNQRLPPDKRRSAEQIAAAARFSMIFGDGRTAIQGSGTKFDLIISEPSNPWLAGVSNLFTEEFFRSARDHLTEDGVLAQWIQTYDFTLEDYLVIVRTLRTSFPHFGLVRLAGGVDTILLASQRPLLPTAQSCAAMQALVSQKPRVDDDLRTWFGGSDVRYLLLQSYQLSEEDLSRMVDASPSRLLNTDMRLCLEFDSPLHLFSKLLPDELASNGIRSSIRPAWQLELAQRIGCPVDTPEFYVTQGDYLLNQVNNSLTAAYHDRDATVQMARQHYQRALSLRPKFEAAERGLARANLMRSHQGDPVATFRELVHLAPQDAAAHAGLAEALLRQGMTAEALEHLRLALKHDPRIGAEKANLGWANNLAWILATHRDAALRQGDEAVQWAQQACEADDHQSPALADTLAAALAESGRFEEAIKVCQQTLARHPHNDTVVRELESRLKLYRASQPYHEP